MLRLRYVAACGTATVQLGVEGAPIDCLGAPSSSLLNSVIVLSVSAPERAVFIFLRSRSTSLSPVLCLVIVFSFRAVLRAQPAQISLATLRAHPAKALAQLLCASRRLLEGGEVVALLSSLFFSSLSPLRRAFAERLLEGR